MPVQPPEKTIEDWTLLFCEVNQKVAPVMDYSNGWFRVPGRRAVREADVLRWTDTLRRRSKLNAQHKKEHKNEID